MTSTLRRRTLSDHEREHRRTADRERVKEAAQELLSSEGWVRWVRARQMFHSYSANNSMLLALEFHRRGVAPEPVAGFRTWLKLGRCVRRGEVSMKVLAPVPVKNCDNSAGSEQEGEQDREARVFFRTAPVFSMSQTDPLPGVDPLPLVPPCEPLTGDSHADLIGPLIEFATSLGYALSIEPVPGATAGWCDSKAKRIVVDADLPPNGQVRVLVHETVHALGIDYQKYTRPQAEVIVDTTTLIVLSAVGLDTSGETIPYIAGWGETGALEAVTEFAAMIDTLARKVEMAITASDRTDAGTPEAVSA